MIEPVEFKYALREFGIPMSEEESAMILKNFDLNRDGKLSANEFFHCMREDCWNQRRQAVVEAAYNHLDVKGGQSVTIADLEYSYDYQVNPEF